ncbi:MAG: hypothetical protein IJ003_04205 [Candidatus Gastranaerophilales bacterium]|nr:hypothetical protein [Candidatus Gastranaerophilales bacterium]
MRQILSILVPLMLMVALILNQALPADAAKKAVKKKGMPQEEVTQLNTDVDNLVKKLYERELYTPEDTKNLVSLKLKLDGQMDIMPEASFAPIYFKIGNIYRLRGEEKDAIVCYQTILENFSETAYGPKSRDILAEMGIEVKLPSQNEEELDEEF